MGLLVNAWTRWSRAPGHPIQVFVCLARWVLEEEDNSWLLACLHTTLFGYNLFTWKYAHIESSLRGSTGPLQLWSMIVTVNNFVWCMSLCLSSLARLDILCVYANIDETRGRFWRGHRIKGPCNRVLLDKVSNLYYSTDHANIIRLQNIPFGAAKVKTLCSNQNNVRSIPLLLLWLRWSWCSILRCLSPLSSWLITIWMIKCLLARIQE